MVAHVLLKRNCDVFLLTLMTMNR